MNKNHAADVLTTALEGGIGYWSVASKIERDDDLRCHSVTLEDAEHYAATQYSRSDDVPAAPDFEPVTVTSTDVARAIREIGGGRISVQYMGTHTVDACCDLAHASGEAAEDVLCEIDADIADQIVQYAALGQIIYG